MASRNRYGFISSLYPINILEIGKSKFDWTVSQSELVLRVAICTGRHPPRKSSDISSFLDSLFTNYTEVLCTYQFIKLLVSIGEIIWGFVGILRIQKPEAVKSPKIFVWLDLPRKRIKTKKTKGFLLAVNYYCGYDRKRTSNRSAMSVFFIPMA